MKIHEYQAKELLKAHGVPVQQGQVAFSLDQVPGIVATLAWPELVLKAQVHAGGRGKAGGIKLVRSETEAVEAARKMFGMRLVTPQTGAEGKLVRRILFTEAAKIKKELYAGLIADRGNSRLVFMISSEGGVDIEKVAEEHPEQIIKEPIDPGVGLQTFQCRRMAYALGLADGLAKEGAALFRSMYDAFCANDCSLVEINPLIITEEDRLLALDVKVNLDDNALYRHPELAALRDLDEEDPLEVRASKYNLNYIKLDGNVGCMVNGAGLAMATMDLIKLAGAEPANFLDVGGGASVETVANGFRIILSDPKVRAILINIFGGIVRCDRVAKGVIEAAQSLNVTVPIVVRLAGTNAAEAGALLKESGLKFHVAEDLVHAAQCIVRVMAH